MILQALTAYYEAMLKKDIVAPPGWDKTFKVSFWLELNDSGELIDVIDQRLDEQRGNRARPSPDERPRSCQTLLRRRGKLSLR